MSELAARKKRARKAIESATDEAPPPAKRAKTVDAETFWREQRGILPAIPKCDVCTDSTVVETPERDWVCEGCAKCLSRYAAIDDAPPTFEERQELKSSAAASGTSAGVLSTWIEGDSEGALQGAAARVDKPEVVIETRLKSSLLLVDDVLRHFELHRIDSGAIRTRARMLLRLYVVDARHGLDSVLTVTWCKVAFLCVLRAAAESRHSFLPDEKKRVLHLVADTHTRTVGSVLKQGVRCNDGKSVAVIRGQLETDLKLQALPWATHCQGFTARFSKTMDAKQRTQTWTLIDWFASQPDNSSFNSKGKEKGQLGCRAARAVCATAIVLLQRLSSSNSNGSVSESTTSALVHGVEAHHFAFFSAWLVCGGNKIKPSLLIEKLVFGRLKRVFAAYARQFIESKLL